MTWEAWATLAVVVLLVFVLVKGLAPTSGAMMGAMVTLLALGIVTPTQALSGFANPAPFTIAALYVLARAVEKTGALTPIVDVTLGTGQPLWRALLRLTVPTTASSAFLNDTAVVAMLIPQIEQWAQSRGRSPSNFLMPLSFAAILGGITTLMGTSTNIVVSGLLLDYDLDPMGFFEISKVGVPVAVVCLTLIVLLAPRVLPQRRSPREDVEAQFREFIVDMVVEDGGPLDGRPLVASLRNLPAGYVIELERGDTIFSPVPLATVLQAGDRLRFAGRSDQIVDLQQRRGLTTDHHVGLAELDTDRQAYFELVLGDTSPLIGGTVGAGDFRRRYQAAVLAIHRAGRRIDAKIADVPLHVGDTLLVQADSAFKARWGEGRDFLLVSPLTGAKARLQRGAGWVAVVAIGMIVAAASGLVPLVTAALIGSLALIAGRIVTPIEARDAINLDVLLTIAAAFGVAAAMVESGLADIVGEGIVDVFGSFGAVGVLFGVMLTTTILKEVMTNKAAVLLVFPIAISAAELFGADPRPFAIAVALSGGLAFLTPIGFTTNMMVYGPGGYRYTDYARLGGPLTIASLAIILILVPIFWPF